MPTPDDYDFYQHPATVKEVQALVLQAVNGGLKLRVRGAAHSEAGSVLAGARSIPVMLDRLNVFEVDASDPMLVRAGAGISLGGDPYAIGRPSQNDQYRKELSLFAQLQLNGLALPVTGGISHQTLAGFIMNGAAGGSLRYSFLDAVESFTFVDGTAKLNVLTRKQHGDDFQAALVNLGLFGVAIEYQLRCVPTYNVIGFRSVQPQQDCDFNLFEAKAGDTRPMLEAFLREKEYARVLWWPQPGVERVELWEAHRYDSRAHRDFVGSEVPPPQAVGLPSPAVQQLARLILSALKGSMVLVKPTPSGIRSWSDLLRGDVQTWLWGLAEVLIAQETLPDILFNTDPLAVVRALTDALAQRDGANPRWFPRSGATPPNPGTTYPSPSDGNPNVTGVVEAVVAKLINLFQVLSPHCYSTPWKDPNNFSRRYLAQLFSDVWHDGLPMDNPIDDALLPVTFTEMWFPIERTADVMLAMKEFFATSRLAGTGTFCIELYAATRADAWLSPAYRRDVFRVDPFWVADGDTHARDRFFKQFWSLLYKLPFRYHWAKALDAADDPDTGAQYVKDGYPQYPAFAQLRSSTYDPKDVFLTDYWKAHLDL